MRHSGIVCGAFSMATHEQHGQTKEDPPCQHLCLWLDKALQSLSKVWAGFYHLLKALTDTCGNQQGPIISLEQDTFDDLGGIEDSSDCGGHLC